MKFVTVVLFFCALGPCLAEMLPEPAGAQFATILKFYDVLAEPRDPTVADFESLFGTSNEAEVGLIIRQDFPSVPADEARHRADVVQHVNDLLSDGNSHPSRFLRCLKAIAPIPSARRAKRMLQIPPETTTDFRRFRVMSGKEMIVFEFSQNEPFIENVYLPGGMSIYDLLPRCAVNVRSRGERMGPH